MIKNFFTKIYFFLFSLLLMVTPFVFTFVNEELFEFNKMLFTYAITILLLAIWLIEILLKKQLIFKKTFLDIPMLLFLISQMLATIFSIHQRTSIFGYYTRFNGGLLSTIVYLVLFYVFINKITQKQHLKLIKNALIASTIISVYAILEHFGHSFSCLLIINHQFDVSCWVQDVQNRVYATLGQPNWLAAYLVTLLPVSIVLFIQTAVTLNHKIKFWQIFTNIRSLIELMIQKPKLFFYFSASILMFLALIFTKSRSGLIAFLVSLVVIGAVYLYFYYQTINKAKNNLSIFISLCIFLLVISLIFGTIYNPSITNIAQISKLFHQENETTKQSITQSGGTESGEIRKIIWPGAIKVWQRYPIFGSGVETFAYSYYQDRLMAHNYVSEWNFLYNKAHNEFLNYLATTGLFGLLSYLLLLSVIYLKAILIIIKQRNFLVLGLLASLMALTVSNFFGFSTVMVSILLFIFAAIISFYEKK